MKLLKKHTHIHGFEDYNIVCIGDSCLTSTYGFYVPYSFDTSTGTYIINKDLPVKAYNVSRPEHYYIKEVIFEPRIDTDNKKLLDSAKKVFVHQSCTISRSLIAEKYKKSLNPFLSDVVVIPKPDYGDFRIWDVALFVHEEDKIIIMVTLSDDETKKKANAFTLGQKLKKYAICEPKRSYQGHAPYNIDHILDAELMYVGELLYIPNCQSWAMDVLTLNIPADKLVYESTVQDTLGNSTNQLDFDSLCSIMDMLNSSDEDTVSAGLKSLSMMDWMHYTQSVKFILMNTNNKYNWIYNKASNSTSVKYMLRTISGSSAYRRRWPGDYDNEIYEADYELFKKLKCHYHKIQAEDIINSIRNMDFIRVNSDGVMVPNIKQLD